MDEYSRKVDRRYLRGSLPRKIAKGRVLVHNHVIPVGFHKWLHNGASGFRAWTQKKDDSLTRCHCGWTDLPHYHFKGAFGRYWPRGPWRGCERIQNETPRLSRTERGHGL
jgi:hypothetical protein